jgi:biopolymer transport protein ExbD
MRLPEEPEDTSFQINIVPMIDVIFAILTFFIMSTLFLTRSEGLPVNLPKAATAETQQQAPITVTVNGQGEIAINRQPVLLENLEATIRAQVGQNESALVVINADASVSHGQVVAVMDRLRLVKGVKLAIATTKP